MKINLPNIFTYYRILAVPLYLGFFLSGYTVVAAIVFITAAISDFFDGYFARKLGLDSDFGKLMDPLADKIITATAFVCLSSQGLIPVWVTVVIISREFLVTGIRSIAANNGKVVAARFSGKIKTTLQMLAIIEVTLKDWPFSYLGWPIGVWLTYAAVAATIWSCAEYCYDNREIFK
ncbi:MAG: CDP-diacylglycerol--glycerol-3-phosphate 3-phosphatidyltransferase [Candidatus Nomurabacteria bacterium]|jgi:CDP-diacylglycerol--glycerol-3-phosphate 3-phosphatidyltransferase|nr:CDP-diacylglycerol--glycerol-3-phosphate 3-phosphatidyltransferase [Candidatus Nomurabacteria bacterium]